MHIRGQTRTSREARTRSIAASTSMILLGTLLTFTALFEQEVLEPVLVASADTAKGAGALPVFARQCGADPTPLDESETAHNDADELAAAPLFKEDDVAANRLLVARH
jgi:hypothetical protein